MYQGLTEAELSREKERLDFELENLETSGRDPARLTEVTTEIAQLDERLAEVQANPGSAVDDAP
jgi:hypothetical protein